MKISSIATTAIFALALVTAVSVDAKSKAPSMSQVCAADIQANCADKKGKAVKVSGKHVLVLNFASCADEDLWADLHEEAKDEFRTPEMQALHLIRVMLRGQEAGV